MTARRAPCGASLANSGGEQDAQRDHGRNAGRGTRAAVGHAAIAKPAECFTTDEGRFPCEFVVTDKDGSFEISGAAVGYSLVMERPGVAAGYLLLEGRSVALPGQYLRSSEEPACWVNDETQARICAW